MRAGAIVLGAVLLAGLPVLGAQAEQSTSFGDYTIHYNALPTTMLDAEVARQYGIRRSGSRALLNVSVMKKKMGLTGQPVEADVKATATNLNAQLRRIEMRRINDHGAIYYVGEVPVSDRETLRFTVEVTPAGAEEPMVARFEQQFFTD